MFYLVRLDLLKLANQNFDEKLKVTASDLKLQPIQIKNEDAETSSSKH